MTDRINSPGMFAAVIKLLAVAFIIWLLTEEILGGDES